MEYAYATRTRFTGMPTSSFSHASQHSDPGQTGLPFDALCRTARRMFAVSAAAINLPERGLAWLDLDPALDLSQWGFTTSCDWSGPLPCWIPDATQEESLASQPYVTRDPGLRFTAGLPIGPGGNGRFSLFDTRTRPYSQEEARQFQDLAALADHCLTLESQAQDAAAREAEFRLLAETSTDTMVRGDLNGTRLYISPSVQTLLGYDPTELVGRKASELVHPDDAVRFGAMMQELRQGRRDTFVAEMRQRHKDGHWVWMEAAIRLTRDRAGLPTGYVTSVRGIARRKDLESKLARMASHDMLTGLPNRFLFTSQLDDAYQDLSRGTLHGFTLLYMDLDRFKQVNDTRGHQAGDAVLREAATRFQAVLRGGDIVARLGGDEFTAILPSPMSEAEPLAKRLIHSMQKPITLPDGPVSVGLSIGIALAPKDGGTPDLLVSAADRALYAAKAAGRNTYRFHSG